MSDEPTTDARHISDTERIRQVDLQKEMQRSYLDYAMSDVVHTPIGRWQNSMVVTDNVALTSSRDVIENLSKEGAVDKALISIGYSKWGKGQLERELAENIWLTVPADEHILFDVPYELRYAAAFEKLGVNPNALVSGVGHA